MTKFVMLLWIFMKSTCTSFAGLASLPEIRQELVDERHWATDAQIDQAIVITRTTPGPVGVWVVSVGYTVDGWPGAIAGWIAMAAPSLLVILLVGYFGRRAQHPRVRGMLQCVVLASATLLVIAAIPIGRDALNGPLTIAITAVALPLLLTKRINTLWIVAGAAALSFTGSMIGVAQLDHTQRVAAQHALARQEHIPYAFGPQNQGAVSSDTSSASERERSAEHGQAAHGVFVPRLPGA